MSAGVGGREGRERIALVPAAGSATRISPIPCSKELLPVRFEWDEAEGGLRPRVAAEVLLRQMRAAGALRGVVVIRHGKWDIPAYFGDGSGVGMDLAYMVATDSSGVPFSLEVAVPLIRDATVLTGFPDIVLEPESAFQTVVEALEARGADLVLGLLPPGDPSHIDQVRLEGTRVAEIRPKPSPEPLDHAWAVAAWGPSFTAFLRERVMELRSRSGAPTDEQGREISLGHVIADAVGRGLKVEGAALKGASYVDVGTPEGLARALRSGTRTVQPDPSGSGVER